MSRRYDSAAARRRWAAAPAAISLLCVAAIQMAAPQSDQGARQSDEATLGKVVRLPQGATTLAGVTTALSEQTGARIDAAECVRERKLTVSLDGVTARQALDALAELNGWTWYRTAPGRWLVARPTIRRPSALADVPRAMQAALPKDFRTYIRLDEWNRRPLRERTGTALAWRRAQDAISSDKGTLVPSLIESLKTADAIPYARLDNTQKDQLLLYLFFRHFDDSGDVLYDRFMGTHRIEPATAVLELDPEHPDVLMVNLHDPDVQGVTGFGGSVPVP